VRVIDFNFKGVRVSSSSSFFRLYKRKWKFLARQNLFRGRCVYNDDDAAAAAAALLCRRLYK
jgi:hypothetical protein